MAGQQGFLPFLKRAAWVGAFLVPFAGAAQAQAVAGEDALEAALDEAVESAAAEDALDDVEFGDPELAQDEAAETDAVETDALALTGDEAGEEEAAGQEPAGEMDGPAVAGSALDADEEWAEEDFAEAEALFEDEEAEPVAAAAAEPAECEAPAGFLGGKPGTELLDTAFVENLKTWLDVPVVRMTLESRNEANAGLTQADIDRLDRQWVRETEGDDQPLITAVLNSPLSTYLLRVQAGANGLFSEIFVMDNKGLNAGQSSITTDYWQGDEAKFQKTYDVGDNAVFIDEPEFHDETDTWRAQVNMTLTNERGGRIGAVTVEVNLTELARRRKAGI